jgi:hypothetical protein
MNAIRQPGMNIEAAFATACAAVLAAYALFLAALG